MESLWSQIRETCISLFTDAGFLQAVGGLLAVVVAGCVKKVRQYIIKRCKELTRTLTGGPDRFTSHTSDKYEHLREELAVLRAFLEAARVSIYQFHNGDRFTLSDPIFKMTCAHENVRHGIIPDSSFIKYILVSTVMNFIAPLIGKVCKEPGVSEFDTGDDSVRMLRYDISKMNYDAFRYHMDNLGTRTAYAVLLYSHDRKSPLGVLVIQYVHADEEESGEAIRHNIASIRSKVCQLEFLLDEGAI